MRSMTLLPCVGLFAVIAVTALPAVAATHHTCPAAVPSSASSTWDFKGEANTLFGEIQSAAGDALFHADQLQTFAADDHISWLSHASQWTLIRDDINEIGAKLCRLEAIRSAVLPWQRLEIDRIETIARPMASNAQAAIVFADSNQRLLWVPSYRQEVTEVYNGAKSLTGSVDKAVEFASVSKEYRDLAIAEGVIWPF